VEQAVIKVGEVDRYDSGEYAHFKDASGKAWNCNEGKYIRNAKDGKPIFSTGRRLKVAYNTSEPKDGRKYGAKWINEVALAEDSEQLTWPDREPYVPKGNGGFKSNGEFRTPEQIMRGQALEIAEGDIEKAKEFYAWILGDFKTQNLAEEAQEKLDAVPVDDEFPF
jgi:hypothetical protein